MNLYAQFQERVFEAVAQLQSDGDLPDELELNGVTAEPPRDASHGDVATNAALVLAKRAKKNPREIATKIAELLEAEKDVEAVDVAGPGFINLTLARDYWLKVVSAVIEQGEDFGRGGSSDKNLVNLEYVSANPTGPLHVGHCRGAIFGDALANLLAFTGRKVTKEYYMNDAGSQVETLARSAFLRYREALGEDIGEIPEGFYPGEYLVPVGKALADAHGDALKEQDEAEWLPVVKQFAIDQMMDLIRADLKTLNIEHEEFFSEQSLTKGDVDQIGETINWLEEQGLIYQGRLEPPKGKTPDDWEDREQTLFRAKDFGDDVDRALKKSNGDYTYFAADIAYHHNKMERGYLDMINVWGADHGGYVKRMKAAVKALSEDKASLDVKICQLVNLFRGGEPVKMSKRSGNLVTLQEIVEEVGPDPVRFMMLYRKNDAPLDFDFTKVVEQSKDNPVFYVQYAHARCYSAFRRAHQTFDQISPNGDDLKTDHLDRLTESEFLGVMRQIGQFPRAVEAAAAAHEPHRIAFYLYEIASEFNALWTRGKESPHLRFTQEDDLELTLARLVLVAAVARIIASGLSILGVNAPKEMR